MHLEVEEELEDNQVQELVLEQKEYIHQEEEVLKVDQEDLEQLHKEIVVVVLQELLLVEQEELETQVNLEQVLV